MTRRERDKELADIVEKMLAAVEAFIREHRDERDEDGWPMAAHLDEIGQFAKLRHDDLLRFIYD